jgi:hypothetical protein
MSRGPVIREATTHCDCLLLRAKVLTYQPARKTKQMNDDRAHLCLQTETREWTLTLDCPSVLQASNILT